MFLRHMLAVPTDEFFEEAKPLVADHPLFPYIETFALDPARQRAEYQKRVRALKVPELTYRHYGLMHALQTLGEAERVKYHNIAMMHGDYLYYDAYLLLRRIPADRNASQLARACLKHSPYAPIARAAVIARDLKLTKEELAAWEKEAQHPEVFLALARRALADNRPADAEGPLTKAIELSPDRTTYRMLAEVYRKKGDEDKWLATLERFLKEPDPGLAHAQVRVEIAEHFMAKKDYKRAQPYAEAAAETWAAWAMLSASKCADGLEDWDKAEQWARNVAERYDNATHVWFFWCLRTGHGNRAAAQQVVEKQLEKVGARRSVNDVVVDGVYQAATGKRDKAAELFQSVHQRGANPAMLLTAILEYDAVGDKAKRDRALAGWPDKTTFEPMVALLRKQLAKGEKEAPTKEEIDAALKQMPPDTRSFGGYAAGRFLQTRGQKELATEYLKQCIAGSPSANTVPSAMAGLSLQELEEKK
jgi:tetratricopeptide (TPR) repeat protein